MEYLSDVFSENEKEPCPAFVLYSALDYYNVYRPHKSKLVESASLKSYAPTTCSYQLSLKLVKNIQLSSAQLDAVGLCCKKHEEFHNGYRFGFLLGDGTGVGKTRIAVAIVVENILKGRTKALWITVNSAVIECTKREFSAMNFEGLIIHEAKSVTSECGVILLTTYKQLTNRKKTFFDWLGSNFQGVVIFDECHRAKSAHTKVGGVVLEVQNLFPQARVVYLSATAASDASALHYASRLHLWGIGLQHETFKSFESELLARGCSGLELLAMEMRLNGIYIARQLRFDLSHYAVSKCFLSADMRNDYDLYVDLWKEIAFAAKENNIRGRFWPNFYSSQQSYFQAVLCSFKVQSVVDITKAALSESASVVIGLQSTGESAQKRNSDSEDNDDVFISACKENITLFVSQAFKDHEELRLKFLSKIKAMKFPINCIDDIIYKLSECGIPVAEMTGRRIRIQNKKPVMCLGIEHEIRNFQNGIKRVAIISDAASTGLSLHSDANMKNTTRRFHILLEIPWSAEKAIQQFGRTNRSNQVIPPHYLTLVTNVPGEYRFASSIASRIATLGALTQGTRRTVNTLEMQDFDLFNSYGKQSMSEILDDIISNSDLDALKNELEGAGIFHTITLEKFFNRLLSLRLRSQNYLMKRLIIRYDEIITEAKQNGLFSDGVDVFAYGRVPVQKLQEFKIPLGNYTRSIHLLQFPHVNEITFEAALSRGSLGTRNSRDGFYQEIDNDVIVAVVGNTVLIPSGITYIKGFTDNKNNNLKKIYGHPEAQRLWQKEQLELRNKCIHTYRSKTTCNVPNCKGGTKNTQIYLLSGAVFSVLSKLPILRSLHIASCVDQLGKRHSGIRIPESLICKVKYCLQNYSSKTFEVCS